MKASDFYEYMENSLSLSETTLSGMKELIENFPYFAAGRSLYLKNLVQVEDICFGKELKKAIGYVPDRKRLFLLIEGERYGMMGRQRHRRKTRRNFEQLEGFSDSYVVEDKEKEDMLLRAAAVTDYFSWAEKGREAGDVPQWKRLDETKGEAEHQESVEAFVPLRTEKGHEQEKEEDFLTETLARVYIEQGKYERALDIFQKLHLKYPEKGDYFATCISDLKKSVKDMETGTER